MTRALCGIKLRRRKWIRALSGAESPSADAPLNHPLPPADVSTRPAGELPVSSDNEQRNANERRSDPDRKSPGERLREADRRTETRIKKRVPCEVTAGDTRQRGFILDTSPKGLFVQTPKPIDSGVELGVELSPPGRADITLRARVARSRRVPPRLAPVAAPGVGLRITMAPPEWYEFVAGYNNTESPNSAKSSAKPALSKEQATPDEPAPEKKKRKRKLPPRMAPPLTRSDYRVKAKQTGGPRSRSLVVKATSREDAELRAIAKLGNDWKIIGVEGA
jgi:hypothetical protein